LWKQFDMMVVVAKANGGGREGPAREEEEEKGMVNESERTEGMLGSKR